jgi:hypothetical protein
VFEDCDLKGGVRQTLLPFAVIGLCGYTIAYPCVLFYILYKNRLRIMEDQLLRAEDRGGSRLENPNCYQIRKMYHKCVCAFAPRVVATLVVFVAVKSSRATSWCGCSCYVRMYYHFRPDYWFWIVIILGRKLLIAVTALMFNKNPAFQMAVALLVLFICYALQVSFVDSGGTHACRFCVVVFACLCGVFLLSAVWCRCGTRRICPCLNVWMFSTITVDAH